MPIVPSEQASKTHAKRAEARKAARDLHLRAADAARAGDCAVAREVDAQIRERDAKYHSVVFQRDIAIQRCFDARKAP